MIQLRWLCGYYGDRVEKRLQYRQFETVYNGPSEKYQRWNEWMDVPETWDERGEES